MQKQMRRRKYSKYNKQLTLDLFTCPFLVRQQAAHSDHAMLIEHFLQSVFLLLDEV
jgi:hypothetical protein